MGSSILRNVSNLFSRHSDSPAVATARSKMDEAESPSSCNFPEMLARDLEISEAAFLSKSMTAGAPIRALATTERPLYASFDSHHHQGGYKDALSKECSLTAIGEHICLLDLDDNSESSDIASLTSDSGSESGAENEPPSVHMRQQYVGTAATSVTAHCSSSKGQLRSSLDTIEAAYREHSWVDFNMDDSDSDDAGDVPALKPAPSPATKRHPVYPSVFRENPVLDTSPASSDNDRGTGRDPRSGSFPLHPHLNQFSTVAFIPKRPHTSSGTPTPDKPRLVEISRSAVPQRRSSLQFSCCRQSSHLLSHLDSGSDETWHSASSTLRAESPTRELLSTQSCPTSPIRRLRRSSTRMSGPAVIDATPGRISEDGRSEEPTMNEIIGLYAEMFKGRSEEKKNKRETQDNENEHGLLAEPDTSHHTASNEAMSEIEIPEELLKEVTSSPAPPPAPIRRTWHPHPLFSHPIDKAQLQARTTSHKAGLDKALPPSPPRNHLSVSPASSSSSLDQEAWFFRTKARLSTIEAADNAAAAAAADDNIQTQQPPPPAPPALASPAPPPSFFRTATTPTATPTFPRTSMPLPPYIIENLRVCIVGFPDTMLQTSALSIETIRAYARKLRGGHRSREALCALPVPAQTAGGGGGHSWNMGGLRRKAPHATQRGGAFAAAMERGLMVGSLEPAACMGRIFPGGSEYLCDALYAHLVAYGYISSLCGEVDEGDGGQNGRGDGNARNNRRTMTDASSSSTSGTGIPTKAVKVLGIGRDTGPIIHGNRDEKDGKPSKFGFFKRGGKGKEKEKMGEMVPAQEGEGTADVRAVPPSKGNNEVAIREIQAGLLRCVGNLVARLQRADGRAVVPEEQEVLDPYLLRALIEVVRVGEEGRLSD